MSAKTRQAARKAAAAGTGGPEAAAAHVRSLDATDAVQAVQIGQTLLVQRQTMPRGTFEPWLRSELDMCRFTAARFMRATEVYGASVDMVRGWTQALLFALSTRSLPAGLRAIIEAQIAKGEHFTKRAVFNEESYEWKTCLQSLAGHSTRETPRRDRRGIDRTRRDRASDRST